jgi:shikimate dehydrogenase
VNATGTTRVAAVIGDPVAHSRSPAMHNAAFRALDLDWLFVAFSVPAGAAAAAVGGARALGVAGLSVTMPHKAAAATACDRLEGAAGAIGVVNTIDFTGGQAVGACTDGPGFLGALADEDVGVDGRSVLILGAGGAARAIAHELGTAGAAVTVAARRLEQARDAAAFAGGQGMSLDGAAIEHHDVIVNATPIGMRDEPPPFEPARLHEGQFVFDTIYPHETPLLAAARARGIRCAGGLGMLVHQGALAFERWTGCDAPIEVMRQAALAS